MLENSPRPFGSLIIFYDILNDVEDIELLGDLEPAIKAMYNFFNCGQADGTGTRTSNKLIDWEQDSQLICSAVNKVAGQEVRSIDYLHWWTFMGYYTAIG